jgi:hypothetical protein
LTSTRQNAAIQKWIKKANKFADHSKTTKIGQNELETFLATFERHTKIMENAGHQNGCELNERRKKSLNWNWTMAIYLAVSIYLWYFI